MGYGGILEDHKMAHVPATVVLDELNHATGSITQNLKHGRGRSAYIVLVPQPSEDPNDPLNWSSFKKLRVTLILSFGGIMFAAVISGILNPGIVVIAADNERPLADIVLLSGYQLLVAASTGTFVNAFARKYGKRPVFLVSSLCGTIGSIIGSATHNYEGLLAARIVQGGSTAAYESLMVSMIGDIYFVHERGLYMAAIQFVLGCVSNFVGIVAGPITTNLGWRYLFHLCTVFCGLQTILLFLFCPETQYRRDVRLETDENVDDETDVVAKLAGKGDTAHHVETTSEVSEAAGQPEKPLSLTATRQSQIPPKKTFVQELAIFTGTYANENLFQLSIAPFMACTNLVVLWVTVITGTITATYVAQAIVLAQLFSPPPYSLTPTGNGNLFLGPFTGGVVATVLLAVIYDPVIKALARRNNGVYEPEYRLVMMPLGIFASAAMMGWGVACQNHVNVYATATLHGLNMFGILAVAISAASYGLDAFRSLSGEMFVAGIIYKNFLFYAFSNFVNGWVARSGPAQVFYVLGGLNLGWVALTPLIYIFGKRYRSIWARHNILERLNIRTHAEI